MMMLPHSAKVINSSIVLKPFFQIACNRQHGQETQQAIDKRHIEIDEPTRDVRVERDQGEAGGMSEEVRIETRIADEADLSYHLGDIERDVLGLLEDGLVVTVIVRAVLPGD